MRLKLDIYPTRELVEQANRLRLQGRTGILGDFPVTFENFVTNCIRDKRGSGILIGDCKKDIILSQVYDELLNDGKLRLFDTYRPGYVRQLGVIIGELKRQALDSEGFKRISPATAAVQDIAAIYEAYQEYLDRRGFYDKEDRYRICLEHIHKSKYVSKFDAFSFREFHHMPRIQKKILEALGERAKVENSPLKTSMEKITVVEAKDRRAEVYLLAEQVLEDLEAGLLPERMCIAVRSPNLYRHSLCQVFREAGIPLRWGERHVLIQNPFVRALFSALEGKPGVYFEKPLANNAVLLQNAGLWAKDILDILYSLGFPERFCEIYRGDLKLIQRDIKAWEALENLLRELRDTGGPRRKAIDLKDFAEVLWRFVKDHSYSYGEPTRALTSSLPLA